MQEEPGPGGRNAPSHREPALAVSRRTHAVLHHDTYRIIFFGHFAAQAPQFVHFSESIYAMLSTTLTASNWHTFSHILQPIQPTEQAFMTSLPLSFELHCTRCFCSYGTSSIRCFGQAAIHLPQALQASLSTTAMPSTI